MSMNANKAAGRRVSLFDIAVFTAVAVIVAILAAQFGGGAGPDRAGAMLPVFLNSPEPGNTASAAAPLAGASKAVGLLITELMPSNKGAITDATGRYSDWIELYNASAGVINLSGFALSDNIKKPRKYVLPPYMLEPGEYVIVYADGRVEEGSGGELHAPFKLKNESRIVLLTGPGGGVLQQVDYPKLEPNRSYAMDLASGKFAAASECTPGFGNNEEGHSAYLKTRRAQAPIGISEVMAANTLTVRDSDGEYSDCVELCNPSGEAVDITGWGLSDTEAEPKRWVFPETALAPGEHMLVFCSGKNRAVTGRELHTDFRLNAFEDTVLLSNALGQVVSEVRISRQKSDVSLGLVPGSASFEALSHPTPGYPNTGDGWNAFQKTLCAGDGSVVINEVTSANSKRKDRFGEYPDWIELYNRSKGPVRLKGWGLTDKPGELGRWQFPDITLEAGQYLIVFASGRNLADGELHADFKVGEGDILVLTDSNGAITDRCFMPALSFGLSYVRMDDSRSFGYSTGPTPGAANADTYPGMAPEPVFSVKAGMYDVEQAVALTVSDPDAQIFYTTDGSTPTQNSTPYTGPIPVKATANVGGVHDPAEVNATVIRAVACRDGYLPSAPVCATYLVGAGIGIPVVSLATDDANLFDPKTGIYANPSKGWEKPAHVELLETNGDVGFSQDIGLTMFGAQSKIDQKYKGFAVIARSQYGKNSIDYPIFPGQPEIKSYKSFVLRPGSNEANSTMIRDVLITSLARETADLDTQDYRPVVLFVNGKFWGVNFIREKINSRFISSHHGVDEANVDLLEANSTVKSGSNEDYKALLQCVKDRNCDLSDPADYQYVADRIDIQSIIDWYACEICTGNSDLGNIRFWRANTGSAEDMKWRWILYDFCWGFWNTEQKINRPDIASALDPEGNGANGGHFINTTLITGLLKNDGFRRQFIERLAYHINVTFSQSAVDAMIKEITDPIRPYMDLTYKKWGYGSLSSWEKNVRGLDNYLSKHTPLLKRQMKEYFHLSEEEMKKLFP